MAGRTKIQRRITHTRLCQIRRKHVGVAPQQRQRIWTIGRNGDRDDAVLLGDGKTNCTKLFGCQNQFRLVSRCSRSSDGLRHLTGGVAAGHGRK